MRFIKIRGVYYNVSTIQKIWVVEDGHWDPNHCIYFVKIQLQTNETFVIHQELRRVDAEEYVEKLILNIRTDYSPIIRV